MCKLFFVLHFIFLLICYSVWTNIWIPPSVFPYFQFIALGFPVLLLIDFLLIIIWFFFHKKIALVFLILSLGLLIPIQRTFNFWNSPSEKAPNLKVMTYNAHYFSNNKAEMLKFIENENPDVVLFQELWKKHTRKINFLDDYYTEEFPLIKVYSRYPIIESKEILDKTTNGHACYTDLLINNKKIRIINIYLEPMYLSKEMVKAAFEEDTYEEKGNQVKNNLVQSFKIHQEQLNMILPYIQKSPYPVILAGDFNAVPNSYEYFQIKNKLNDAFLSAGKGLGTTFHDYKFPLRLDYIFHSDSIQAVDYKIIHKEYSDHFPVVGQFYIPSKNP